MVFHQFLATFFAEFQIFSVSLCMAEIQFPASGAFRGPQIFPRRATGLKFWLQVVLGRCEHGAKYICWVPIYKGDIVLQSWEPLKIAVFRVFLSYGWPIYPNKGTKMFSRACLT